MLCSHCTLILLFNWLIVVVLVWPIQHNNYVWWVFIEHKFFHSAFKLWNRRWTIGFYCHVFYNCFVVAFYIFQWQWSIMWFQTSSSPSWPGGFWGIHSKGGQWVAGVDQSCIVNCTRYCNWWRLQTFPSGMISFEFILWCILILIFHKLTEVLPFRM